MNTTKHPLTLILSFALTVGVAAAAPEKKWLSVRFA